MIRSWTRKSNSSTMQRVKSGLRVTDHLRVLLKEDLPRRTLIMIFRRKMKTTN